MIPSRVIINHELSASRDTGASRGTGLVVPATSIRPGISMNMGMAVISLVSLYFRNISFDAYIEFPVTVRNLQDFEKHKDFESINRQFIDDITELKKIANVYVGDKYDDSINKLHAKVSTKLDVPKNSLYPLYKQMRHWIYKLVSELKKVQGDGQNQRTDQSTNVRRSIASLLNDILSRIDTYQDNAHYWIATQSSDGNTSENNELIDSIMALVEFLGVRTLFAKLYKKAVMNNDYKSMRNLLSTGQCDYNILSYECNCQDQMPLSIFAWNGILEGLDHLLKQENTHVNQIDKCHRTPLHHATVGGHVQCVKQLLCQSSITPNKKDRLGDTALLLSIRTNHSSNNSSEIVQLIVDHPVGILGVNTLDRHQSTPLIISVEESKPKCVEILLNTPNIEVNYVNCKYAGVLHCACYMGDSESVKLILNHKEGKHLLNVGDLQGNTPLHHAILASSCEVIELLLALPEINVSPKNARWDDMTPLHIAAIPNEDNTQMIDILLRNKDIDCNIINKRGYTPLHMAAMEGNHNVVLRLLQEKNINIHKRLFLSDMSPLETAYTYENQSCIMALEEYQRNHSNSE